MRYKFFNFTLALFILFSASSVTAATLKTYIGKEEPGSNVLDLDVAFVYNLIQPFQVVVNNKFYTVFQLIECLQPLEEYNTLILENYFSIEFDIKPLKDFFYNEEKIENVKICSYGIDHENLTYLGYNFSIYVKDKSGKLKEFKYREITAIGKAPFFNYLEEVEVSRIRDDNSNDAEIIEISFPLK